MPPLARRLGPADGALAPLRGLAFVYGTRGVRRYALAPVLIAGALFATSAVLGAWGAVIVGRHAGGDGALGVALAAALVIAAVLGALVLATALAQPLASFALDRIVRAQEAALGVPPPADDPGGSFFRSLRVTLAALLVGTPLLVALTLLGLLFPPAVFVTVPLKVLLASVLLAWDFLDYPLGLRGLGVRERAAWMRAHAGAVLGFGTTTAALLLIPGLGLFVLPAAVAGATRVVAAAGGAAPTRAPGDQLGTGDERT